MHERVYQEFEKICLKRGTHRKVLEVGAIPKESSLLNMRALKGAQEKIGINLIGPYTYKDFSILKGNANSMTCFKDGQFDTVFCNSVLEHDKLFWKTILEIKRVTRSGGLIVIGVPGYTNLPLIEPIESFFRMIPWISRHINILCNTTITFRVHPIPGDYYRFSVQTFKDVFFEGIKNVEINSIMLPPRIIGSGFKP